MKRGFIFVACLILSLILSGCASWVGGSDYVVEITKPDGTVIRGQAHNAGSAEGIEFSMKADPETGMPTAMTLAKRVVVPGDGYAPVMEKLIDLIPAK